MPRGGSRAQHHGIYDSPYWRRLFARDEAKNKGYPRSTLQPPTTQLQPPIVLSNTMPRQAEFAINPLVSKKFNEWAEANQHRPTQKARPLPLPGLQRWYESRKAVFVARGGNPDAFDQAFDDVDIAVAVDGWSSLDLEMVKYLHTDVGPMSTLSKAEIKELTHKFEVADAEAEKRWQNYHTDLHVADESGLPPDDQHGGPGGAPSDVGVTW